MFKEFRDFILKGNMLDLAIGVIIGAAFGKVVTAFTELLLSTITFGLATTEVGAIQVLTKKATGPDGKEVVVKAIDIGPIINSLISLIIVGFALFLVVKAYNTAKKRFNKPLEAAGPPEIPADVKLLAEIRDLLKSKA